MCGIAGGWSARSSPEALRSSLCALAHRGPDGCGEYCDPESGVMLGHVRLAIIDLSAAGRQPMFSDDGQVILIFNGEIYNYRELRIALERQGVAFRSKSDTEVLLRLYIVDGIAALRKLNGIFAFAIYDRRRRGLLLARDALGVKPLYFAAGSSGIAFASEIKALLPLTTEGRRLDEASLHRYLSFLWCPGAGTPLAGVRKLGPGEALWIDDGKIARHWTWYDFPLKRVSVADVSRREAIAEIQERLRAAVQRQLVSDVQVGAFLSGGLDSSAVVAFARERIPGLRCFTINTTGGGDTGETEDLPYARRVALHLDVPLDVVSVDASRMAADLEHMVWQLDEPMADLAPLNVLYISQLARRRGIKVLLSGAGGDDLFTGYRRHVALRGERLWSWLPVGMRRKLSDFASALDQRTALGRRLARLLSGAGEEGDVRLAAYFLWVRHAQLLQIYSREMRAAVSSVRAEEPLLQWLSEMPADRRRLDRMLALEQRFFLADHNLIYTDKMSMAAGVEVRVPFLDLELVKLAARIPDRMKQRGLTGKWVLKKAMEPYLPRDVIYRPKTGFGAPLRRWIRHDLRELVGDLLSQESLRRRGLFDPEAIRRLIADNDAGRRDAAYHLMSVLCVEIWCRRFLDEPASRSGSLLPTLPSECK